MVSPLLFMFLCVSRVSSVNSYVNQQVAADKMKAYPFKV